MNSDIKASSYGLVTLSEIMQRYRLDVLTVALLACQIFARDCLYSDALGTKAMTGEHVESLRGIISMLCVTMNHADADKSLVAQITAFEALLAGKGETRPAILETHLKQIILGVETVLKHRLFMFIPEPQAIYFMNLEQFGKSVTMFPEALGDMLETSNCYAADRPTACVFHSMRVAEHGLRHIARELNIQTGTKVKPLPIEYATWEDVLVKIEAERNNIRKEIKSREQEEKTIEYAGLADHCSHLKDLWRNPTMHSRGLYSLSEAAGVMTRVAEFMNLIAGSVYAPPVDAVTEDAMKVLMNVTKEIASRT